ncbi:MAG: solute carrier family 23 protein [Halieaceae bacterium]|nr:solute carrier family 23 protein [Halieaceae bacterium]
MTVAAEPAATAPAGRARVAADLRAPLFGLEERPPLPTALLAALQHLLAVFGGIVTAPLIIAGGMGLDAGQTNTIVTSALFVSGLATLLQIGRVGPIGSGLLAIQGTSFTFIGAILFAWHGLPEQLPAEEKLALVFGSAAVASIVMMPLAFSLRRLQRLFSPVVTGTTVLLLGLSLVVATLGNLQRSWLEASANGAGWTVLLVAACVFATTALMARLANPWARMCSILAGLVVGFGVSLWLGVVRFDLLAGLAPWFTPVPLRYGLAFDWQVFLVLMPIFVVTATESVGDLTATQALSQLPVRGPGYWSRLRGGVVGDAFNSLLASVFSTFPNTTFSQNNGVIRLTGIASRHVGYLVAAMLMVMGCVPVIAGFFQMLPPAVIYGATLLMFLLVVDAGINMLRDGCHGRRDWFIVACALPGGGLLSQFAEALTWLPLQVRMVLQFPVSTGAFIAMALEVLLPRPAAQSAGR